MKTVGLFCPICPAHDSVCPPRNYSPVSGSCCELPGTPAAPVYRGVKDMVEFD
ncbi:hypothetical protein PHLCEN_2v13368 [Hermanssonia centrifuga]|uniref:Uncharacterized protein n=1 Tax=Hermanssonia centrifuga TaxID=98765 RepID=A0A2R6NES3_9APHY|nr:hypothetical protein PHLCEN_2v13368 [Hermanssonia centrifuga]